MTVTLVDGVPDRVRHVPSLPAGERSVAPDVSLSVTVIGGSVPGAPRMVKPSWSSGKSEMAIAPAVPAGGAGFARITESEATTPLKTRFTAFATFAVIVACVVPCESTLPDPSSSVTVNVSVPAGACTWYTEQLPPAGITTLPHGAPVPTANVCGAAVDRDLDLLRGVGNVARSARSLRDPGARRGRERRRNGDRDADRRQGPRRVRRRRRRRRRGDAAVPTPAARGERRERRGDEEIPKPVDHPATAPATKG